MIVTTGSIKAKRSDKRIGPHADAALAYSSADASIPSAAEAEDQKAAEKKAAELKAQEEKAAEQKSAEGQTTVAPKSVENAEPSGRVWAGASSGRASCVRPSRPKAPPSRAELPRPIPAPLGAAQSAAQAAKQGVASAYGAATGFSSGPAAPAADKFSPSE